MGNRYYHEGEGRSAGVQDLFAAVAPRYDLINDLQSLGLHRRWKRRMVRVAEVKPGESALDVCCGTGDIAFELVAAGAQVTAVDFSEPMLEVARRRSSSYQAAGSQVSRWPAFEQGDALALRFPDASFDLGTIAYGLRNLRSLDDGLREIARVTRPSGRLVVLEFAFPSNPIWRAVYRLYLQTLVPLLGWVLGGDAATHAYILESLNRYPGPAEISRRMEATGWRQVRYWNLLGGVMTIHRGEREGGSEKWKSERWGSEK